MENLLTMTQMEGTDGSLALCRAVTEAHGGTIWVEDACPHGCIFRFTLPREAVSFDEPASQHA